MKRLLLAFAAVLTGCLLESKDVKSPSPFEGEWKQRDDYVFTMRDSLYRMEIMDFAHEHGYASVDDSDGPPWKPFLPDSLIRAFSDSFHCDRPDCDSILWIRAYYYDFKGDSVADITLLNGAPEKSFAHPYLYDKDSLYILHPEYRLVFPVMAYEFYADGDSLRLGLYSFPMYYGRVKPAKAVK
jgi:hypothetical protein